MALRSTSYIPHRWALYGLLWVFSVIELGLTGFRIHHTRSTTGHYDPIVAELLVASIFTILWVPVTLVLHRSATKADGAGSSFKPLHGETGGNLFIWLFWFIGAIVVTNKWPTRAIAAISGQQDLATAIVAFAWLAFIVLTSAKIFGLMEYAAIRAANAGASTGASAGPIISEKPAATATPTVPPAAQTTTGAEPGVTV